jgi:hypothetical protein
LGHACSVEMGAERLTCSVPISAVTDGVSEGGSREAVAGVRAPRVRDTAVRPLRWALSVRIDGAERLSRLGGWLLRVGVAPVLFELCRQRRTGRDARFPEALKGHAASPLRRAIRGQLALLARSWSVCNEERPREALGRKALAEVCVLSPRQLRHAL